MFLKTNGNSFKITIGDNMKRTLRTIFLTLFFLGAFALGEYFATNKIFNLFDDRLISKSIESTSSSNIITGEPTGDIISDETSYVEVYKGNNDANNETNTLTLFQNKKFVLDAKNADFNTSIIGWYEQDQNFVILHEVYYSNGDTSVREAAPNTILVMYYTGEGTLNISSIFDKRTIKLFKLSEDEARTNASSTDYSKYTLIK